MGRTEFNNLVSALRVLMLHMLKWDHQPERRTRSWVLSIDAQRADLDDVLSDNPGLRPIAEAIVRAYRRPEVRDSAVRNGPMRVVETKSIGTAIATLARRPTCPHPFGFVPFTLRLRLYERWRSPLSHSSSCASDL